MRKFNPLAKYDESLNYWVKKVDYLFVIGLTDFGQEFIGTITTISDLPQKGQLLAKGAIYAVVESDKASTELFLPIGGKVVAINEQLLKQSILINDDCYEEGWMLKVQDTSQMDWQDLLSAEAYAAAVSSFFNK